MRSRMLLLVLALSLAPGLIPARVTAQNSEAEVVDAPPPGELQEPASVAGPEYVITAPLIQQPEEDVVEASGGVTVVSEPTEDAPEMILKADEVRGNLQTREWHAEGQVTLQREGDILSARDIAYNQLSGSGSLRNAQGHYGAYYFSGEQATLEGDVVKVEDAILTTCDLETPHWSLRAGEVEIRHKDYGVARKIGFWIGNTKVFALPSYRFGLGQTRNLFPTPGYDQENGAYLRVNYPLSLRVTTGAVFEGRITQKNGIMGVASFERELAGDTTAFRGTTTGDVSADLMEIDLLSMENRQRRLTLPYESRDSSAFELPERRSHVYLRLGRKERIFDPEERYLYLHRLPEAGFRWLGTPVRRFGENNALYADSQISYGRYQEHDANRWHSRFDLRSTLSLARPIGQQWVFDPVLLARFSNYSTGDSQSVLASSLALGRRLTPRYFATFTYVKHLVDEGSPFEFDNIDVKEKLATRLQADWGRTRSDLTIDFDLQRGGVYDWSLSLARAMHCFEPQISYQNRYRSFSIDIRLIPTD